MFPRSLNRTSVGLKLTFVVFIAIKSLVPQSNQRGIETPGMGSRRREKPQASIEPAWD